MLRKPSERALKNAKGRVLQQFNFLKVWGVMNAVHWTWCGKGVPTIDAIHDTASRLLDDVIQHPEHGYCCGTGGLKASIIWHTDAGFELGLEFVLEEQSSLVDREPA